MIEINKKGIFYKKNAVASPETVKSLALYLGEFVEIRDGAIINTLIDDILSNAMIFNVVFNRELGGIDLSTFHDEWKTGKPGKYMFADPTKYIEVYWYMAFHPVISATTPVTPRVRSVSKNTAKQKKSEPIAFASLGTVRDAPIKIYDVTRYIYEEKVLLETHKPFTVYDLIRGILYSFCLHGTPEEREQKLAKLDEDLYIQLNYSEADLKAMGAIAPDGRGK